MKSKPLETIGLYTELGVSGLLLVGSIFLVLSLQAWAREGVPPTKNDETSVILVLINGIRGLIAGIIAMRRWQAHSLAIANGVVVIIVGYCINEAQLFVAIYISFNLIIGGIFGLIGADKNKAPSKISKKGGELNGGNIHLEEKQLIGNSLRISTPMTTSEMSQTKTTMPQLKSNTIFAPISIPQEKKCPKCGGMLPADVRFCNKCGFAF